MLQLTLFGRFSLMGGDGVEIPVKSQKAKALLAYLALSPGMERSREEIMALLWSDRAEAQARASLRQVLFGLRQVLGQEGQEALRVSDHTITLDQSRIAVEEKTAGAELLSGFHLSDPAFEEWLRDERLRVEDVPSPTEDSGAETIVDKPSIAVLPFANLSGDPEQEYFSDGITQDITTELGRFESLVVISPNSSAAFKDHASNLDEIGEKLGAQFCVQGSVRKLGERVRVSAQLLEIGSGRQLWADRYDRQLEDIFAIQDEVASRVAAMVSGHVDNAKRVQSERKPAKDVTAYELVLRADWLFHKDYSSPEGIRLLEKALERDPDYALAHAYLAMHHAYNLFGAGLDIEEADRLTRAHGGAASRLSPEDAAVHAAISEAYLIIGDFELATYHADTALALNPHEYHSRVHASLVRSYTGRHAEALELIEHLQQNDPYAAISARETIFEIHYLAERYEAALASMTGWPNPPAHMLLEKAAALAQLGRMSEAEVEFQRFESEWPETWSITDLVQSYRRMCARPEEWEKWLEGFRKAGLNV